MALDFDQTVEIEEVKQRHKIALEELQHKNKMMQLEKELEIAKINNGVNLIKENN